MKRLEEKEAVLTGTALEIAISELFAKEETKIAISEVLDEGKKAVDELHPIGQMGEPDDNSCRVLPLSCDESKFVAGEELRIAGAYSAH